MKIMISNCIQVIEPIKEIIDFCKKELEIPNPEYAKRKKMGYWVGKIPKNIKLYDNYEGNLYLPMGVFSNIWKIHPYKEDYIDYSVIVPINVKSNIKLREYQQPCVRAVKEHFTGILNMGCGMGKTISAIEVICQIKQKTLWIANSHDLLEQAKSSAENNTTLKTSMITEGKCDISGDLILATPQSLLKFIENGTLKQDLVGCVVIDECQKLSANPKSIQMYRQCLEYFAARYKIGLTATIHRADGLEGCILKLLGEPIYKMIQNKDNYDFIYNNEVILTMPIDKFQVPCHVIVRETEYNVDGKDVFDPNGGTIVYAKLITDMAMDEKRNNFIISDLKKMKGSTIILSDRVDQLKYLVSKVVNGIQIDGNTPKKLRKQALDDVRNGKIKYLFASYNLCREGLDCPILSNLVIATPFKDYAYLVQSCGRIQRPFEGKTIAYVYDYVDRVALSYRYFQKRRAIYRKNNWEIDNMYLGGK